MTFIHELADWPGFTWDSDVVSTPLATVRHKQGRHLGELDSLGFEHRAEAGLVALTDEVVQSSAIEGARLETKEVRSSIAKKLGIEVGGLPLPGREVEGVVEMMLDATRRHERPLTVERLFEWHAALFPTGRSGMQRIRVGAWRDDSSGPMQVVSGPIGRERVHFEAPAASRLDSEVARFIEWFESARPLDPVLRAALAHFWFVTIHPFDDGNGRIARAIAELALCRADGTGSRYYSMSSAIAKRRKQYYERLESSQRSGLDITAWILWFLDSLDVALDEAADTLDSVLRKAAFFRAIESKPVHERQRKVLSRVLDGFEGHMTTSKYAKLAKCSTDTAFRDLRDLLERGMIVKNPGGGRSTSYRLAEPDEIPR